MIRKKFSPDNASKWASLANATCTVESTSNFTDWTAAQTGIASQGSTTRFEVTPSLPNVFYRVRKE